MMNQELSQEQWSELLAEEKREAEAGNVEAMYNTAMLIRFHNNDDNIEDSFPYFKMAADHGCVESAGIVGDTYYDAGDEVNALKYYKQAADGGDETSQQMVGALYMLDASMKEGWESRKQDLLAEKYLRLAALKNLGPSQRGLFELMRKYQRQQKEAGISDDAIYSKLTKNALHWLACAYLNGEEKAIEYVEEKGLLKTAPHILEEARNAGPYGYEPGYFEKNVLEELNIDEVNNVSQIKKTNGGCYIATAVYGSYDCPQVWVLRRYRDYSLSQKWCGRAFIRVYYFISPFVVKCFGRTKWFQKFWREKLNKLVDSLKERGIKDTPYCDKKWK